MAYFCQQVASYGCEVVRQPPEFVREEGEEEACFPFLIYYGAKADATLLNRFETVVLEPAHYPDITAFRRSAYAYVSLGEVHPSRDYFERLQKSGSIVGINPHWKSYYVRLSPFWQSILLDEMIPDLLLGGYDGLMIDTVDSILYHHLATPMEVIAFINLVKHSFPKLKIMLNRAFKIVPDLPLDALLLESTISSYDFERGEFFLQEEALSSRVDLPLYSVDYWYRSDWKSIVSIYQMALERGYYPLVTDLSLQSFPAYAEWVKFY